MKLIVDVNLSPSWARYLRDAGFDAIHWSEIGAPEAADEIIADRAKEISAIILTRDLDFGTMLAASGATAPSVLQLRGRPLTPERFGLKVASILMQLSEELASGAFVTVDVSKTRLRLLPLRRQ